MTNSAHQAILAKLDGAKEVGNRFPFVSAPGTDADIGAVGVHKFALLDFDTYASFKNGATIAAYLFVLESNAHKVGSIVVEQWFIDKASEYPNMPTPKDRCIDFVRKLTGCSLAEGIPTTGDLLDAAQPGRGIVIDCRATRGRSKKGNAFTERVWSHVEQAPADIKATRADIEAAYPHGAKAPPKEADKPKLMPKPDGWPAGVALPPQFYDPASQHPDGSPKDASKPAASGGGSLLGRLGG